MSCTLAEVDSTEWIGPESLSTPTWTYRCVDFRLHPEIPLIALLGLMHLWVPLTSFVFGGAGS